MEKEIHPLKVGQEAEARTFEEGFRGAWFRCKIKSISKRKGRLGHVLEYHDFPDEKLTWTMLYQAIFRKEGKTKGKHKELMLRPHYPPIYNEKEMPHVSEISEVTVIVCDSWRVGDLVDWWNSDCYWSGSITELLGDDEAKIDLKQPPYGEGLSYEVLLKDLRPSLDWSPKLGWKVPTREGATCRPCARLVKPTNQGQVTDVQRPAGSLASSLLSSPVPSNSAVSNEAKSRTTTEIETRSLAKTLSKKRKGKQDRSTSLGPVDSSTRETHGPVADSGQNRAEPAAEDELNPDYSQEKYRVVLRSKRSDTLEAAVLDLEEYLNKVKWLKKILEYGIASSDALRSQWQLIEQLAPK